MKIRPIRKGDNLAVAKIIRTVLMELGAPKKGTAYEDPFLDNLSAEYAKEKSAYFILEEAEKIIGGAGIAPLKGIDENICELQKMYVLPTGRGKGYGKKLMQKCLTYARERNYSGCYLETLPYMDKAQKLYAQTGFSPVEFRVGQTDHNACNVWLFLDLKKETVEGK